MGKKEDLDKILFKELARLETTPGDINKELIKKISRKKNNNTLISLFVLLACLQGIALLYIGINGPSHFLVNLVLTLYGLFTINSGLFLYFLYIRLNKGGMRYD